MTPAPPRALHPLSGERHGVSLERMRHNSSLEPVVILIGGGGGCGSRHLPAAAVDDDGRRAPRRRPSSTPLEPLYLPRDEEVHAGALGHELVGAGRRLDHHPRGSRPTSRTVSCPCTKRLTCWSCRSGRHHRGVREAVRNEALGPAAPDSALAQTLADRSPWLARRPRRLATSPGRESTSELSERPVPPAVDPRDHTTAAAELEVTGPRGARTA